MELDFLVRLVDEDFDQWHPPGRLTFPFYFTIAILCLLGMLLLWASFQFTQPILATLFASSIATIGIAMTLFFNSFQLLEFNIRRERFLRISKEPRFKSVNNSNNQARNELLLMSLIEIGDRLPTSLRDARRVMPNEFREGKLLRHLLEPI